MQLRMALCCRNEDNDDIHKEMFGLEMRENLNYIYLEMDAFGAYIFVMLFTAIPSVSGSARLKYYLGGVEGERKGGGGRESGLRKNGKVLMSPGSRFFFGFVSICMLLQWS